MQDYELEDLQAEFPRERLEMGLNTDVRSPDCDVDSLEDVDQPE